MSVVVDKGKTKNDDVRKVTPNLSKIHPFSLLSLLSYFKTIKINNLSETRARRKPHVTAASRAKYIPTPCASRRNSPFSSRPLPSTPPVIYGLRGTMHTAQLYTLNLLTVSSRERRIPSTCITRLIVVFWKCV